MKVSIIFDTEDSRFVNRLSRASQEGEAIAIRSPLGGLDYIERFRVVVEP